MPFCLWQSRCCDMNALLFFLHSWGANSNIWVFLTVFAVSFRQRKSVLSNKRGRKVETWELELFERVIISSGSEVCLSLSKDQSIWVGKDRNSITAPENLSWKVQSTQKFMCFQLKTASNFCLKMKIVFPTNGFLILSHILELVKYREKGKRENPTFTYLTDWICIPLMTWIRFWLAISKILKHMVVLS